jgi:hypothetical protein
VLLLQHYVRQVKYETEVEQGWRIGDLLLVVVEEASGVCAAN